MQLSCRNLNLPDIYTTVYGLEGLIDGRIVYGCHLGDLVRLGELEKEEPVLEVVRDEKSSRGSSTMGLRYQFYHQYKISELRL